jgi:hypothetical protein
MSPFTESSIGDQEFKVEDLPKRAGIRWAAGSPQEPRSATWRLWGDKKGDVYLAMRSQGGRIKASFHRDRRCSVGFTSEYQDEARERFGIQSRHMARWTLPDSEVVRIAQILIPGDDLVAFEEADIAQMRWLPAASPGFATVVSVFIAEPPDRCNWSNPQTDGDPIGIMQSPTRFTWAVSTTQALDAATLAMIEDARQKAMDMAMANGIDFPQDDPAIRLAIWGHSTTPADLFFVDLRGQKHLSNVRSDG